MVVDSLLLWLHRIDRIVGSLLLFRHRAGDLVELSASLLKLLIRLHWLIARCRQLARWAILDWMIVEANLKIVKPWLLGLMPTMKPIYSCVSIWDELRECWGSRVFKSLIARWQIAFVVSLAKKLWDPRRAKLLPLCTRVSRRFRLTSLLAEVVLQYLKTAWL